MSVGLFLKQIIRAQQLPGKYELIVFAAIIPSNRIEGEKMYAMNISVHVAKFLFPGNVWTSVLLWFF